MEPLVSIITPVYNAEEFLEETILSVLNQEYVNWELILIDDCSSDKSNEIIEQYLKKDKRIKYLKNKKNSGPAITRNNGINISKGNYIAFLDSDDLWYKDKLKNQINFMLEKDLKISHGNYYFCNLKGKILKKIRTDIEINYKKLLLGNQFKTMTMVIKREILTQKLFPDIKHEDYAFFLNILNQRNISVRNENYDSLCRIGRKSVSSNKLKSALWTWRIYRQYEKLSLIKSSYYFINYTLKGILKYK
ncbi:putative glycosyltransferase [Fusobacterium varium]|nr:putative glycosyltransferase [Fusobacterium varium]